MGTLLACEHLGMKYDAGHALRDVTFALEEGDFLSVVGENGSGKSTLMKAILGLCKPTSGMVRFKGVKPGEIGYLPQQTPVQKDFPASVWEVALSGRRNQHQVLPFYTAEDKRVARENLERLGAGAWRAKSFRALSGGQQQRVLLARALCACSKLLLLDEPCTGLDPMAAGELYDMLTKLNRAGTAVLMVSHDVAAAAARSNKILHLQTEPLFFGGTEEYLASPAGRRMMGGAANV